MLFVIENFIYLYIIHMREKWGKNNIIEVKQNSEERILTISEKVKRVINIDNIKL